MEAYPGGAERSAIQAEYVADGQAALHALRQHSYDLLCLELHLPDMSGLDVCRQLRAESNTALLPIVLLTCDDKEATLKESLEAGITEILRKSSFEELSRAFKAIDRWHAYPGQGSRAVRGRQSDDG